MRFVSVAYGPDLGPFCGGSLGVNALLKHWNQQLKIISDFHVEFECKSFKNRLYEKFFLKGRKRKLRKKYHLDIFIKKLLTKYDKNTIFICHNIPAAYELLSNHRRVVMIYHGQGSPLYEAKGFGAEFTPDEVTREKDYEYVTFGQSLLVGFPSIGARDAYLNSSAFDEAFAERVKDKSRILYNCCNYITAQTSGTEIKTLVSKLSNKKIILTVSTLNYQKGVDLIPEKLSTLTNFKQDYYWLLCGTSGALKEKIIAEVKKYGLEDNFRHIDYRISQDQVGFLYKSSVFYLMHHRVSIFDLASLEAMSFGLIPVLSPVGGNLEINKENNIIFMQAGKDLVLPRDDEKIKALSDLNRQVLNDHFSPKVFLKGYEQLAIETMDMLNKNA